MALTLTATTIHNITRVTGTVAGGAGGTASVTIFSRSNVGGDVNKTGTAARPAQQGIAMDVFRIKVIRLVGSNTAAGDYFTLKDITGSPGPYIVWSAIATGDNFDDQTNLGDEFRNGLQLTVTTTATANDSVSGVVFELFLYHGLS